MMVWREASRLIHAASQEYPVVAVSGPYQSGKTTLVRRIFPSHDYVSLVDPGVREFARSRPLDFLRRYPGGVIIDEYRLAPELSHAIRARAAGSRRGRFILVTSHLAQKSAVAPAPFGMLGTVTLLPLSIGELSCAQVRFERDGYIYNGFMPRLYDARAFAGTDPPALRRDYLGGYVERYVRRLITTGCGDALGRFLKMLAGRVGQAVNMHTYAIEAGVAMPTLMSWVKALEAGFVVFRLPSFTGGLGERVMRAPKFYFTDVGLAAYLLGVDNPLHLQRDPQIGNLFENMVVAEVLKGCRNKGGGAQLYYFRSRGGLEIDLVVKNRNSIIPIEIKCGDRYSASYAGKIRQFKKLSGRISDGYVVYCGEERAEEGETTYVNYRIAGDLLQ